MDIETIATNIELDAGEYLPGLRESLLEMRTMNTINKSNVEQFLKTNVLKIVFTKVNGEERVFEQATIKNELLPEKYRLGKEPEHIISDVVRVYLPDVDEWRSFNKSSLISAEIVA